MNVLIFAGVTFHVDEKYLLMPFPHAPPRTFIETVHDVSVVEKETL